MNRNILLINPSIDRQEHYGEFDEVVGKGVPLGLGFLAAYLLDKDVGVKLVDEQWGFLTREKLQEIINRFQPTIVGFTCLTPVIYRTFELAAMVKEISSDIRTLVGNVHPTILPEESLNDPHIDIVVRGEGEVTLHEYLEHVEGKKKLEDILGISYRKDGEIIHNPDRPYERDLDVFPRFAYELLYESIPGQDVPATILTSRGCPYRCIFCSSRSISGFRYRMNSAERVVADVEYLIERFGFDGFWVADDNFAADRKRVEDICRAFIRKGFKLKWSCQTRGDAVDEEILKLMKQAGCNTISFGLETGTQRLLDLIRKSEKLEDNVRAVKLAHKAGLITRGAFILGLPTETREESLQTIRFARSLPLDVAKFALATPYPGTELYQIAKEEGADIAEDWSCFTSMSGLGNLAPPYIPKGRTPQEMKDLQKRALLSFYLRPRHIRSILRGEVFE
ncbi:MAG: B12-binding domain-containing radical SAM protein, partial [Planctomycetota bacterium]